MISVTVSYTHLDVYKRQAETYAKFIDTPVATEDDILKYAFALFLNHDFEKSLEVVQKGLILIRKYCQASCLSL